jgi:hypothetical protein
LLSALFIASNGGDVPMRTHTKMTAARFARLQREAQAQGGNLSRQYTPKHHREYFAFMHSSSDRGFFMTLIFGGADVVEAFIRADPDTRVTFEVTDDDGNAVPPMMVTSYHAFEDAEITDLVTGQTIQKSPYPIDDK